MAEMVPAEFWRFATKAVREEYPEVKFIGEVYNPADYRHYLHNGFDWLYDKVGMYDTMRAVITHHLPTSSISYAWQQTDDIRDHMLYFLENHDEQRVASDFFAADGKRGVPAMIASLLMQQNPFMLYAGQEYGERGMDSEGFSGNDGRTTIFDYWSVDTLCRAAKKKLTAEEQNLFKTYKTAMQIARREKAVVEGLSFDLMYVNGALQRQYVFLRHVKGELLLVAVNFDGMDVDINVHIPAHAFDYLQMEETTAVATDLLTREKLAMTLRKNGPVAMNIPAYSARIWKIKC